MGHVILLSYFIFIAVMLILCERQGDRYAETGFLSSGALFQCPQQPGLGPAGAKSWELSLVSSLTGRNHGLEPAFATAQGMHQQEARWEMEELELEPEILMWIQASQMTF